MSTHPAADSPEGPVAHTPRPTPVAGDCCDDYAYAAASRRTLLRGLTGATGAAVSAAMVGTAALSATFAPPAAAAGDGNVLVTVSLRGGADMLSLVVPHGDPGYYRARPTIAVPASSLFARDAMFGLHPALQPLAGMWQRQQLAAVTAVGLPAPNRSHFQAMELVEDANPGDLARTGWLNRTLGLDATSAPTEGIQLGSGMVPTALYGRAPALAIGEVDAVSLNGPSGPARSRALARVWDGVGGDLGSSARSALRTAARFKGIAGRGYSPANGARYPDSDLGDSLKEAARLVKSGVGVRTVTVDYGSWDMHANVGRLGATAPSSIHQMASGLALALSAFFTDLGSHAARVTLVTLTEFGRRVAENGSRGLDHGWGNTMLLMGAGVRGGRYYGSWPGLGSANLTDGDLSVTTDYRSVLAEVLVSRFGVSVPQVFPGFQREHVGAMA